jgi:hypothetical protein
MERGILIVETRLSSPELEAEFHRVYDEVHIKEMLGFDGFVAARRYAPWGHEGGFVAIYEIEAEDIEAARQALTAQMGTGQLTTPPGVSTDPPPVVHFFREISRQPED